MQGFLSYSHADKSLVNEFRKHLSVLTWLQIFLDSNIPHGARWQSMLERELLEKADVFFALLSPSYFDSEWCKEELELARNVGLKIIPIHARRVAFDSHPILKGLKVLGLPGESSECQAVYNQENGDAAWTTVVGEIDKLFGSRGPVSRFSSVRHNLTVDTTARPPLFGRDQALGRLFDDVKAARHPIVLCSGLGGIGKSALAQEIACRAVEQKGPFSVVVWIDLRRDAGKSAFSLDTVVDCIRNVVEDNASKIENTVAKRKAALDALKGRRALMVFDNYESTETIPDLDREIVDFVAEIPNEPGASCILITSRRLTSGLRHNTKAAYRFDVKAIDDRAAAELIQKKWRISLRSGELEKLLSVTGGVPKYIEIACEALQRIPFDVWYSQATKIVSKGRSQEDFFYELLGISWEKLSRNARTILLVLTFFSRPAKYEARLHVSGLSVIDLEDAEEELATAYLERSGDKQVQLHPLVQDACSRIGARPEYVGQRRDLTKSFVTYWADTVGALGREERSREVKIDLLTIRDAVQIARTARKEEPAWPWNEKILNIKRYVQSDLRDLGYWEVRLEMCAAAEEACRLAVRGNEAATNKADEQLADILVKDVGWLRLRLEQLDEARDVVQQGLEIYEKLSNAQGRALALRHLGKAELLAGLDEYYEPTKRHDWEVQYKKARAYYKGSLELLEQLDANGRRQELGIAEIKLDLGRLYWLNGRYGRTAGWDTADVFNCLKKAVRVSDKAMAVFVRREDVRLRAKAHGNIGNPEKERLHVNVANSDFDLARHTAASAIRHYRKSLKLARKIDRKDEIAHALRGLAEIELLLARHVKRIGMTQFEAKRRLTRAERQISEAVDLYAALGGQKDINATHRTQKKLVDLIAAQSLW